MCSNTHTHTGFNVVTLTHPASSALCTQTHTETITIYNSLLRTHAKYLFPNKMCGIQSMLHCWHLTYVCFIDYTLYVVCYASTTTELTPIAISFILSLYIYSLRENSLTTGCFKGDNLTKINLSLTLRLLKVSLPWLLSIEKCDIGNALFIGVYT